MKAQQALGAVKPPTPTPASVIPPQMQHIALPLAILAALAGKNKLAANDITSQIAKSGTENAQMVAKKKQTDYQTQLQAAQAAAQLAQEKYQKSIKDFQEKTAAHKDAQAELARLATQYHQRQVEARLEQGQKDAEKKQADAEKKNKTTILGQMFASGDDPARVKGLYDDYVKRGLIDRDPDFEKLLTTPSSKHILNEQKQRMNAYTIALNDARLPEQIEQAKLNTQKAKTSLQKMQMEMQGIGLRNQMEAIGLKYADAKERATLQHLQNENARLDQQIQAGVKDPGAMTDNEKAVWKSKLVNAKAWADSAKAKADAVAADSNATPDAKKAASDAKQYWDNEVAKYKAITDDPAFKEKKVVKPHPLGGHLGGSKSMQTSSGTKVDF